MSNIVRAALVQCAWTGDKDSMVDKNIEMARQAAERGAKVLCFQEIFNAPYFCTTQENEHFETAESIPEGPTVTRMIDLAEETGMVIIVPIFEREDTGHYYNTAAVIGLRRHLPWQVPQNPHPPGRGLLGEVLLPAWQPRVPRVRYSGGSHRRLHLL